MAGQSSLRRWKPFLAAFGHVDAAIEAAGPALSRDEFRRVRGQIVDLLRGASRDGEAEVLCAVLDDAMALSLVTLQSVPAAAVPTILASSAGIAEAIGALMEHDSEVVRGLARDVVRGWWASVADDMNRVKAAKAKLDALPQPRPSENTARHLDQGPKTTKNQAKVRENQPYPKKTAPMAAAGPCRVKAAEILDPLTKKTPLVAGSDRMRTEHMKASAKISESLPKKTPPVVGRAAGDGHVMRCSPEEKMEATKRKLREGYQEVEDAKRQRKIQAIQAPKMLEQRERKMDPIIRERSQARHGISTGVRRSLMSSFQRT